MTRPAPRYSYLGPEGTFTERALRAMVNGAPIEAVSQVDVASALDSVRSGVSDYAVVAIENSVEGGVTATLDALTCGSPLVIQSELLLPVHFELVARAGTQLADVTRIGTHPHAWAQCRRWAHSTLPSARHVATTSNAAAAAALGGCGRSQAEVGFEAALAPPGSAKRFGLTILADEVADNRSAVTRFVKVGRPGPVPPPTGADKTTLFVHLPRQGAGVLVKMLEHFASREVNLARIESRPIGDRPGECGFSIDAWGHIAEESMTETLIALRRSCPTVLFLGSYPAAKGTAPGQGTASTSDLDLAAARAWVDALRTGRHESAAI